MSYREKMGKKVAKAKIRNRKKAFKTILRLINNFAHYGYVECQVNVKEFALNDNVSADDFCVIALQLRDLGFKINFNSDLSVLNVYWGK